MAQFTPIHSHAVLLPLDNIDTDQIIPARFLKITDKTGIGDLLFYDWRYQADGTPNPDFVLNQSQAKTAKILVAGHNFGCGSSREHAPWALRGFGFEAVISTSFADIFRSNSLKNGLLPVVVQPDVHAKLCALLQEDSRVQLQITLENQTLVLPDNTSVKFPIDEFNKQCLLHGVDELGYIRQFEKQIAEYETAGTL